MLVEQLSVLRHETGRVLSARNLSHNDIMEVLLLLFPQEADILMPEITSTLTPQSRITLRILSNSAVHFTGAMSSASAELMVTWFWVRDHNLEKYC